MTTSTYDTAGGIRVHRTIDEIPVADAMPRVVRVLIHCYAPAERPIRHVYLRDARQLRLDLPE